MTVVYLPLLFKIQLSRERECSPKLGEISGDFFGLHVSTAMRLSGVYFQFDYSPSLYLLGRGSDWSSREEQSSLFH